MIGLWGVRLGQLGSGLWGCLRARFGWIPERALGSPTMNTGSALDRHPAMSKEIVAIDTQDPEILATLARDVSWQIWEFGFYAVWLGGCPWCRDVTLGSVQNVFPSGAVGHFD